MEWARFEPNFFVVFEPGALEGAPQTLLTLTRIEPGRPRTSFSAGWPSACRNVTTLDLTLLQEALERLLERIVLAIRFMALFRLATGAIVLVGALATSRFQRIREGALLRTLGATRGQLFRIVLAEYVALGLHGGSVTASVLAAIAAWALARWLFEGQLRPAGASAGGPRARRGGADRDGGTAEQPGRDPPPPAGGVAGGVGRYGATALRRYGATALRRYGATALRRYGATALRRYGATALRRSRRYGATALRRGPTVASHPERTRDPRRAPQSFHSL